MRLIIPLHLHFWSLLNVSHSCGWPPGLPPSLSSCTAQGSRSSTIMQSQHFCCFLYMLILATHVRPATISLLFITKIFTIRVLPLVVPFPADNQVVKIILLKCEYWYCNLFCKNFQFLSSCSQVYKNYSLYYVQVFFFLLRSPVLTCYILYLIILSPPNTLFHSKWFPSWELTSAMACPGKTHPPCPCLTYGWWLHHLTSVAVEGFSQLPGRRFTSTNSYMESWTFP